MTTEPHNTTVSRGALLLRDLTLVFTDIQASTEAVERHGDRDWFAILMAHNRIVRRRTAEFGGVESNALGDGFLLAFETLESALRCVDAIQRDLRDHAVAHPDREIHIRVGIHTGETIVAPDGSLVGRDVHMASRVADQAGPDEIAVTGTALDRGKLPRGLVVGNAHARELRGLSGLHALHRVQST